MDNDNNSSTDSPPKRQHYWMVAGEIVFRVKDKDGKDIEGVNSVRLNTVVIGTEERFPVASIARAQQGLQMNFHRRMQDPMVEVVDAVLLGLMPLGWFTQEEFHARPEGVAVEEAAPSTH